MASPLTAKVSLNLASRGILLTHLLMLVALRGRSSAEVVLLPTSQLLLLLPLTLLLCLEPRLFCLQTVLFTLFRVSLPLLLLLQGPSPHLFFIIHWTLTKHQRLGTCLRLLDLTGNHFLQLPEVGSTDASWQRLRVAGGALCAAARRGCGRGVKLVSAAPAPH